MKRKRHTPQEIIAKLCETEVELNQGATNRSGVSEVGDQRADISSLAASLRRDEGAGEQRRPRLRAERAGKPPMMRSDSITSEASLRHAPQPYTRRTSRANSHLPRRCASRALRAQPKRGALRPPNRSPT